MAEKQKRGFAVWDKEKLRETAAKGGKAAHELGMAHEFTPDEAKAAGRKGGLARVSKGKNKGGKQLPLPLEASGDE